MSPRAIGEGKRTNVTLTFTVERHAEMVEAYLSGLEDLQKRGGDLNRVASVASFFVSRVDTKVDKLLKAAANAAEICACSQPCIRRCCTRERT